jgi:hypothetical protein
MLQRGPNPLELLRHLVVVIVLCDRQLLTVD